MLEFGPKITVLTGPTAAGKTALALEAARAQPGVFEIINADSLIVYRGLDIGTAKPSRAELAQIPHHLIDIREPHEPFTAGDFVRAVNATLADIQARGKRALIVGGTGFYLKALFYGLWEGAGTDLNLRGKLEVLSNSELFSKVAQVDPLSAQRIGLADRYRLVRALEVIELSGKTPSALEKERPIEPDPRFELWIVDRPLAQLEARIRLRADQMIKQGLIEEVTRLRTHYESLGLPLPRALSAVGYKEVCAYLDGITPAGRKIEHGIPGLVSEISLATRQLVKRQRTWFKNLHARLEKVSHWVDLG
ncbi:tRNA (adenosine(37)-N6)-dimethylallyltransferase MiaA [Bdellovibrionota bacterium FG-1]